jgi:hypothetical protein
VASRFASGAAPVQFNEAPVPNLNRTPRSGESCPAVTQKTQPVPEENMLVPHTLFKEMKPSSPTMDDAVCSLSLSRSGVSHLSNVLVRAGLLGGT